MSLIRLQVNFHWVFKVLISNYFFNSFFLHLLFCGWAVWKRSQHLGSTIFSNPITHSSIGIQSCLILTKPDLNQLHYQQVIGFSQYKSIFSRWVVWLWINFLPTLLTPLILTNAFLMERKTGISILGRGRTSFKYTHYLTFHQSGQLVIKIFSLKFIKS